MQYDVEVIRSKRKTLAIEVTRDGRVIVRAPFHVSTFRIKSMLAEKDSWIQKTLQKMKDREDQPNQTDLTEKMSPTERKQLMDDASRILRARVDYFAPLVGVTYNRITIRCQRTRWGSCSGKGNLNFNALLLYLPQEIMDYVVVHELCHRKQMNHSPAFWKEVERILPDYKTRRKWLREHEKNLITKL